MLIIPRKSLFPVDNLLGPWLIGVIVSSIVFGVTCLQIYLYYTKYSSRDSKFVDTLHLVLISMAFYETTVTNFGDFAELAFTGVSTFVSTLACTLLAHRPQAQIFVGGLLETLVQMFYAVRVWLLSGRSPWMPILIVSPNILKIAVRRRGALGTLLICLRTAVFENSKVNIPYATGSLAFGVACDFLITTSMIYWLSKGRSQFRRTNTALNSLILYTINSGLFFLTFTTTLIYAFFFFVASRLYLCSLLSILNSREHVREQLYSSRNPDHPMVTISTSNFTTPSDNTKTAASEDPVRTFDRGLKGGSSSYNVA
ncbi:hypothetical protein C8J57DRAFT_1376279 [Mycena rebaudengoi]|nr:hypothetical protein C8J57DRAFT_1378520 [Mycena rebaudengoi]KAJ7236822.1 hypothetical protein C8J57DRAFT_1376279 [Mycena rebaudengoi]